MGSWAYCSGCTSGIDRSDYTREEIEAETHICKHCGDMNPVIGMTLGDWVDDQLVKMQEEIDELKMHCFGDRPS